MTLPSPKSARCDWSLVFMPQRAICVMLYTPDWCHCLQPYMPLCRSDMDDSVDFGAALTVVPRAQVSIPGGGDITIKAYLEEFYNYKTSFIGPVFGILCAFMVFFGALAILSLKLINYQRR